MALETFNLHHMHRKKLKCHKCRKRNLSHYIMQTRKNENEEFHRINSYLFLLISYYCLDFKYTNFCLFLLYVPPLLQYIKELMHRNSDEYLFQ